MGFRIFFIPTQFALKSILTKISTEKKLKLKNAKTNFLFFNLREKMISTKKMRNPILNKSKSDFVLFSHIFVPKTHLFSFSFFFTVRIFLNINFRAKYVGIKKMRKPVFHREMPENDSK